MGKVLFTKGKVMTSTVVSIPSYTLTYYDPRLVSRDPVLFEHELTEYKFTAKDRIDALRQARTFLSQHVVSCNHVSDYRKGKILVLDHPRTVIHEFVPAYMVKAMAKA